MVAATFSFGQAATAALVKTRARRTAIQRRFIRSALARQHSTIVGLGTSKNVRRQLRPRTAAQTSISQRL